jgi:type IV secretory pathway TrbL component
MAGLSDIWTRAPFASANSAAALTIVGWVVTALSGAAGARKLGLISTRVPASMAGASSDASMSDTMGRITW